MVRLLLCGLCLFCLFVSGCGLNQSECSGLEPSFTCRGDFPLDSSVTSDDEESEGAGGGGGGGGGGSFSAVRLAAGYETCFILDSGDLKCWGRNNSGQLGTGDTTTLGDDPGEMGSNLSTIDLGTGRTAVAVSANNLTTCALLDNGSVKCWGGNTSGQLGQGDIFSRGDDPNEMGDNLPAIDLGTGRTATQISVGWNHVCAILDNSTLKCWGQATFDQLGYGDMVTRGDDANEMGDNLPAVDLGTGRTPKLVTAGGLHTCVILDDDSVKCFGRNFSGQLGLGSNFYGGETGDMLATVDLGTGRTALSLACSANTTCALLDNGSVKCWGDNSRGQIGTGDTTGYGDDPGEMGDNLPAIDLGTGRTAQAISHTLEHICAILDDDSLKCWGGNLNTGALGIGDNNHRGDDPNEMGDNLPTVDLGTGRTVKAIASGWSHNCAVLDDDSLKCWGLNDFGQLGLEDSNARGNDPNEMGDNLPTVSYE